MSDKFEDFTEKDYQSYINLLRMALDEYESKPVPELIHDALELVYKLCEHGCNRHWVMSIPVEPTDSDIVLATALTKSRDRIAELEAKLETVASDTTSTEELLIWLRNRRREIEQVKSELECPHVRIKEIEAIIYVIERWQDARTENL